MTIVGFKTRGYENYLRFTLASYRQRDQEQEVRQGIQLTIRIAVAAALVFAGTSLVLAQPGARPAASPAAAPVPETVTQQSYTPELIETGRERFAAECGFCHGLDTGGASGGPDLTRSELVAQDARGDLIAAVVRNGRLDAEVPMPSFPDLSAGNLESIVAFVHDQKLRAASAEGGRRAVSADDVQSGSVAAGERYFERHCTECHSTDGDLAGIASRFDGLVLMQRMLNPRSGRGRSVRATPRIIVTTASGDSFAGLLAYEDEFTVALTDANGRYRSFGSRNVSYEVEDPLERHLELLGEYTDEDMHDVVTFLHTLRQLRD